jgi:selenocysteine lyase/cysteine desulfurase
MLAELGLDLVEARVLALAEETRGRARECDLPVLSQSGERASGIVQLDVTSRGADDAELEEALRRKGVAVRILGGRLRVSAHFWNTSADLEALFAALG